VNYYCTTGATVVAKPCPSGLVCGWMSVNQYYACVMPPAMADPSGLNPIACE
jgi:hypothetical protein